MLIDIGMADSLPAEDLGALTGWKSQEILDLVEKSVLPGEDTYSMIIVFFILIELRE